MLKLIRSVARKQSIDNILDATILTNNLNGTYNIKLPNGSTKRAAINMSDESFIRGDVVNVSLVGGSKETAKIIGRSMKKKGTEKIVLV